MKWKVLYSNGEDRGFVEAPTQEEAFEEACYLIENDPELYGCWINYANIQVEVVKSSDGETSPAKPAG